MAENISSESTGCLLDQQQTSKPPRMCTLEPVPIINVPAESVDMLAVALHKLEHLLPAAPDSSMDTLSMDSIEPSCFFLPFPEGAGKPPGMCFAEPAAIDQVLATSVAAVDIVQETHAMPAPLASRMTATPCAGSQTISSSIGEDDSDAMTEEEARAYLANFALDPAPAALAAPSSGNFISSSTSGYCPSCPGSSHGSCSGSPSPTSSAPCQPCHVQEVVQMASLSNKTCSPPLSHTCGSKSSLCQATAIADTDAHQTAPSGKDEAGLAHAPMAPLPFEGHQTVSSSTGKDAEYAITDEEADLSKPSVAPAAAALAGSSDTSCSGSTSSNFCHACILRELIHRAHAPIRAFTPPVICTHGSGSTSSSSIGKDADDAMTDEEAFLGKAVVCPAPATLAVTSDSSCSDSCCSGSNSRACSSPCHACIMKELIQRAQAPFGALHHL